MNSLPKILTYTVVSYLCMIYVHNLSLNIKLFIDFKFIKYNYLEDGTYLDILVVEYTNLYYFGIFLYIRT